MNVINVTGILVSAITLQPNKQITESKKVVKYHKKMFWMFLHEIHAIYFQNFDILFYEFCVFKL